jgi:phosphoglycolate phosphatase
MRAAVFDLDGTLADTSDDLIAAANDTFAEVGLGRPLRPRRDRAIAFAGGRAMLRAGFARRERPWDEADVSRLYPRLVELYGGALDVHTRLYDGVEAALGRLAGAGWALGICTNKPERLAVLLLERLGVVRRFAAIVGADTLTVRKPDPRHVLETITRAGGVPDQSVLVGDTATDREAARRAGVPCVLVGFGPEREIAELLAPEALVDHFDDLPDLLERLVPERAVIA